MSGQPGGRGASLTVAQAADRVAAATGRSLTPGSWRAYVSRGQAPKADGHWPCGCPWWYEATVDRYLEARHGVPGRPRQAQT